MSGTDLTDEGISTDVGLPSRSRAAIIAPVRQDGVQEARRFDKTSGPRPVLLEQRIERRGASRAIRRVLSNGEVWCWSAPEHPRAASANGGTWRLESTLPRDELAALQDAISFSGFFDCAPEYRPDRAAFYAADEVWTAHLGVREHTVAVRGRPITDVPAVSSVADALTDALADAAYG